MRSPSGCGLAADGKGLYAADTEGARLWAFDVEGPGVLRKPKGHAPHGGRHIAGLGGRARFDSLAVMASGNIAVATLTTGMITEISPAGAIVREERMPDVYPTNICFGWSQLSHALYPLAASAPVGRMAWPSA